MRVTARRYRCTYRIPPVRRTRNYMPRSIIVWRARRCRYRVYLAVKTAISDRSFTNQRSRAVRPRPPAVDVHFADPGVGVRLNAAPLKQPSTTPNRLRRLVVATAGRTNTTTGRRKRFSMASPWRPWWQIRRRFLARAEIVSMRAAKSYPDQPCGPTRRQGTGYARISRILFTSGPAPNRPVLTTYFRADRLLQPQDGFQPSSNCHMETHRHYRLRIYIGIATAPPHFGVIVDALY